LKTKHSTNCLCNEIKSFSFQFKKLQPLTTTKHEIDTALTETTAPTTPTPMQRNSSSSSLLSFGRKSPPPIAGSLITSIKNKNASQNKENENNFKTENVETEQQHQFNVIQTGL
jgi:hypothetical protein